MNQFKVACNICEKHMIRYAHYLNGTWRAVSHRVNNVKKVLQDNFSPHSIERATERASFALTQNNSFAPQMP